jgi:hypothetical protein
LYWPEQEEWNEGRVDPALEPPAKKLRELKKLLSFSKREHASLDAVATLAIPAFKRLR